MTEETHDEAVDRLKTFGLSTYAARTFVALVELGSGTAEEVSDAVDVPRTRVYDAAEELRDRGLVTVEDATPRRFHPASVGVAGRTLEREFLARVDDLTDALASMEASDREGAGTVETVTGSDAVTAELRSMVADAEREVVYASGEVSPTETELSELRAAAERNVRVVLVGTAVDAATEIPGAEVVDSAPVWEHARLGRLTIVDGEVGLVSAPSVDAETTYLSALSDGHPPLATEYAVRGSGKTSGLLRVVMALVADRGGESVV